MGLIVNSNLIPLLQGLVTGLASYAKSQDVKLYFSTRVDNLMTHQNPELVLAEISALLTKVVSLTPEGCEVNVSVLSCSQNSKQYLLVIENTGVDLSRVWEIVSSVKTGLTVERTHEGTRFQVALAVYNLSEQERNESNGTNVSAKFPIYFSAIQKRLSFHFSNVENLEKAAALKGSCEGAFLKKVNVVIETHLEDSDFKVDALADAMALSRTQLFRRIKALTKKSPQQYLRFVRLDRAKKLLQDKTEDYNVSEVGYKVGFASKSHFTRSFQKEFGFNPSDLI